MDEIDVCDGQLANHWSIDVFDAIVASSKTRRNEQLNELKGLAIPPLFGSIFESRVAMGRKICAGGFNGSNRWQEQGTS